MKIQDILNFINIYDRIKTHTFPVKTAYKLLKLQKEIAEELAIYKEAYSSIIKEYGKLDEQGQLCYTEDGNSILIKDGCEQECYAKMQELETMDVELSGLSFALEEFDNIELSFEELEALMPFIFE